MKGKSRFTKRQRAKFVKQWEDGLWPRGELFKKHGIKNTQIRSWAKTYSRIKSKPSNSFANTKPAPEGMKHVIMPPFEGPTHQFVIADELDEISKTLNRIQGDIVILKNAQEILSRYKRSITNGSKG